MRELKGSLKTNSFRGKVSLDSLAELSFVLFFSNEMVRTVALWILGSNSIAAAIGVLLPYVPLFLICIKNPRKVIKLDFIILYLGVILFFVITYFFHPEYEYHYLRSYFGVWDHVLAPYRGIYAYLFIRIVDDPKRILKCMKISGWVLMPCFVSKIIAGNWNLVGVSGVNTNASYSVAFGYDVLIFALVFLYYALTEKKVLDFVAAIADIIMILVGGSRGPIIFIGLFMALYFIINVLKSKRKVLYVFFVVAIVGLVYSFYDPLLHLAANYLEKYHMSSRFVRMMLAHTVTDDNRRFVIWSKAIQMIKNKPFGYGAMGSRHVIYHYVYAGYPHSIVLEFLIDYGVFFGGLFLFIMFRYAFKMLFSPQKRSWAGVFLPFFSAACSMFISLTYWSRPEFWACLALGVSCYYSERQEKSKKRLRIII